MKLLRDVLDAEIDVVLANQGGTATVTTEDTTVDEWDMPVFAFHELDYIPSGYAGILAPYIETGPGTMRAAVTLMGLDLPSPIQTQKVVCDLGCGDGEFLIGLLRHVNNIPVTSPPIHGFGIDYDPALIATAAVNSLAATQTASWLVYDFNLDADDLFSKLAAAGVTHVFMYLVPKQLALGTVRLLVERLWESGVVICCHKFLPEYLSVTRSDVLMDLCVYERGEKG